MNSENVGIGPRLGLEMEQKFLCSLHGRENLSLSDRNVVKSFGVDVSGNVLKSRK